MMTAASPHLRGSMTGCGLDAPGHQHLDVEVGHRVAVDRLDDPLAHLRLGHARGCGS